MAVFELGGMTLKSLFGKPETVCYPVEQKPQPAGLKGHIDIDVADCILCSKCAKVCPTNSIAVDKETGTWSIDHFSCVTCFECVRACPNDCLRMDPDYEKPSTKKSIDSRDVPKRERKAKKPVAAE